MSKEFVTAKNKVICLIGDPVEHSPTPLLFNATFERIGLPYVYIALRVDSSDVADAIRGARALNIRGLNITIPHKVSVIPLLDELDPLAERIQAVNTIVNNDGVLKGYNTDAQGFIQPLLEKGIELKGRNVVVLGAGGASRAVSYILAEKGANLVILNRTVAKAEECADRITSVLNREVKAMALTEKNLTNALADAAILVNATSVGLATNINDTPVPSRLLRPDLVVYDIISSPPMTRLQAEAKSIGAEILGGGDMVLWGSVIGFELWTGTKAPLDIMKEAI